LIELFSFSFQLLICRAIENSNDHKDDLTNSIFKVLSSLPSLRRPYDVTEKLIITSLLKESLSVHLLNPDFFAKAISLVSVPTLLF
jgi:hypothetical protein